MKRYLFLACIQLAFIHLHAQNVIYDQNAEVRKVESFNAIDVSGTVSLYISQGNETALAISAGEVKYNEKIKTEVIKGVLHITVDGGMWNSFDWANRKLKAYVSVNDLSSLQVGGASYAQLTGSLKRENFQLEVSGASEVKCSLNVKNLIVSLSGASVVRLNGSAENASVDASGAASLHAFDLHIDKGRFDASGASRISVAIDKEFSADASGGSMIQYTGEAIAKNVNTNGGSKVERKTL